jgi:hypothetical protein
MPSVCRAIMSTCLTTHAEALVERLGAFLDEAQRERAR